MYLLSTQCLLDAITTLAPDSLKALPVREIHLSTVSLAQAYLAIEAADASERQAHRDALRVYTGMVRSLNNLVPFDEKAATLWASLRAKPLPTKTPAGTLVPLSEASTMVVACALASYLHFVDYPQPYHAQVTGLTVVHP